MGQWTALRRRVTNSVPHWLRVLGRRIVFFGTGQTCPLCLSTVSGYRAHGGAAPIADKLRVVGAMRRENDRCPVCHGVDRTRLILLYLEKTCGAALKRQRILHVAPEWGLYRYFRRIGAEAYTPCDLDLFRYRHIRGIRKVDCTSLPFADGGHDLVICSHVLEHVHDDHAALREFRRVLAPGGRAIVQVPLALDLAGTDEDPLVVTPRAREARFCQWDHVRLYGQDFGDRLLRAGFAPEFYDPFASHAEEAEALHLNRLELLLVARRPREIPSTEEQAAVRRRQARPRDAALP